MKLQRRSEGALRLPWAATVALAVSFVQLPLKTGALESGWMCQVKGACAYGGCIPDPAPQCPAEDCNAKQAHYGGQIVQFDINSFSYSSGASLPPTVTTAADCCNLCRSRQGCNTWAFCPLKQGCISDAKPCTGVYAYDTSAQTGRLQRFGKYGACNGTLYPQYFCQLLYNADINAPVTYESGIYQNWTSGTLERPTKAPIVGAPEPPFAFGDDQAPAFIPGLAAAGPGYPLAPALAPHRLSSPSIAAAATAAPSCLTPLDLANLGLTPRVRGASSTGTVNVAIGRFNGTVLVQDTNPNGQPATTSQQCAANCIATPECNTWTFCTSNVQPLGCGAPGECTSAAGVTCTSDGRFPANMCTLKKLTTAIDARNLIAPGSTSNISTNYFTSGIFISPSKLKLCNGESDTTATAAGGR
eukprot:jgi/Botrbrau1/8372/Bobra.0046s0032.1